MSPVIRSLSRSVIIRIQAKRNSFPAANSHFTTISPRICILRFSCALKKLMMQMETWKKKSYFFYCILCKSLTAQSLFWSPEFVIHSTFRAPHYHNWVVTFSISFFYMATKTFSLINQIRYGDVNPINKISIYSIALICQTYPRGIALS